MSLDAIEALCNAGIGLIVSWCATWLVLGYSPAASMGVTTLFFGLSFTRAWIIRGIFRGLENG